GAERGGGVAVPPDRAQLWVVHAPIPAPAGRGRRENRGRPRAGHAPGAHPEDGAATAEEDSSQGCRGGEPWRATGYRSRREPPGLVEEAGRATPVEVTGSGSPPRNTSLAR